MKKEAAGKIKEEFALCVRNAIDRLKKPRKGENRLNPFSQKTASPDILKPAGLKDRFHQLWSGG